MTSHFHQRAYSIVEMAIALVVLGLLLGSSLLPLQTRYERQENNAAASYLEEAKRAIFSYALKNRTVSRSLVYYDGATYTLSADRPYLPCPDIDNDGLEDRSEVPQDLLSVVAATLTTSVGLCDEEKGTLPWKTLGIKDIDPWGNRLTYRVDLAFSDSLTGFDKTSRADIFDRRLPLQTAGGQSFYALRTSGEEAGGVVCSNFIGNTGTGGCPSVDMSNVLAGVVTRTSLTVGARVVPAHDAADVDANGIVEGAVFVLLSHGRNGYGAISRHGRCRPPQLSAIPDDYNMAEAANAYYRATHPFVTNTSVACISPSGANALVLLRENLFVSAPVMKQAAAVGDNLTDDIVLWVGASELFGGLLRADALPSARQEYLPE